MLWAPVSHPLFGRRTYCHYYILRSLYPHCSQQIKALNVGTLSLLNSPCNQGIKAGTLRSWCALWTLNLWRKYTCIVDLSFTTDYSGVLGSLNSWLLCFSFWQNSNSKNARILLLSQPLHLGNTIVSFNDEDHKEKKVYLHQFHKKVVQFMPGKEPAHGLISLQ